MRLQQGSIGTVTLTDNIARLLGVVRPFEENESRNSRSFWGACLQAAVAAQLGHIQLLNPVASGKTVIVDRVLFENGGASNLLDLSDYATGLTTNTGSVWAKNQAGGAPVAQLRKQTNAAELGTIKLLFRTPAALGYSEVLGPTDAPLVIAAGAAITLIQNNVNVECAAIFHWREE